MTITMNNDGLKFKNPPDFKAFQRWYNKDLPRKVGITANTFFKENFRKQGFDDGGVRKWEPRKRTRRRGRGVLMDTGRLRRSIRVLQRSPGRVVIGTKDIPYAVIHNEGGIVRPRVTPKMRKWAWAMYYANKGTAEAAFYKNLALTKKTRLTIRIPKRQFIGNSRTLDRKVKEVIMQDLPRFFGQR